MVELAVTPYDQTHLVVVGTSLRKPPSILRAYFQSLEWQVVPRNVQLFFLFIDDGLDPEAKALAQEFVDKHQGQLVPSGQGGAPDFTDHHPVTHQWSDTAMARVGRNKDYILDLARQNRAEAVWLADADLIMDPTTLTSLWSVPDPIICAVYWTRWQKTPSEHDPVHAGPQVWMSHPYGLSGGGLEEWELRQRLIDRQLTQVYGQGACTLIRREALHKGVSFAPVPGNNGPGLMQGEDRHFCIRAEQLHLRMTADPFPDIFHIYHRPEDEERIPEMLERLSRSLVPGIDGEPRLVRTHANPKLGDLVSLELHALEPVPTMGGNMYPPTQLVRGRLGKVGLHPELEQAVLSMQRSETRVVPVHFGLYYPFPPYRGQRKLIKVTLIDHKPFGFQPVVESEILRNDAGSYVDTTTLSDELVEAMKEVHA